MSKKSSKAGQSESIRYDEGVSDSGEVLSELDDPALGSSSSSSSSAGFPNNGPPPGPTPCTPCPSGTCSNACPPPHPPYPQQDSRNPVRYWDGTVSLEVDDIIIPNGGDMFGHQRSYSNTSGDIDGPNGWNWSIYQLPYIVPSRSGPRLHKAIVHKAQHAIHFAAKSGGGGGHGHQNRAAFHAKGIHLRRRHGRTTGLSETRPEAPPGDSLVYYRNRGGKSNSIVFTGGDESSTNWLLSSFMDPSGIPTTVVGSSDYGPTEIQRVFSTGTLPYESMYYEYFDTGDNVGKLQYVTFRRGDSSTGPWTNIYRAEYTYYGTTDSGGSLNDLQSATQQLYDGTDWNNVSVCYYRYYLSGEGMGFAHALKMDLGPEAYRLAFNDGIDIETATDETLQEYADHYFQYDPMSRAVTQEVAVVCDSCPGGGTSLDIFQYFARSGFYPLNYNSWSTKTRQIMPDGLQRTVYTNHVGLPILHVLKDGSGEWCSWWQYDDSIRVVVEAESSAINGFSEDFDDLVDWDGGTHVNADSGLLRIYSYYHPDVAQGQLYQRIVREGRLSADVLLEQWEYSSHTGVSGSENTIDVPSQLTNYPVAGGTGIVTSWAYEYYGGTNQVYQKTTTLPVISSEQNGSGVADTIVEQFDIYGNLTQRTDQRGIVNQYVYDIVQGVMTLQTLNVSGTTGPGYNVVTTFAYDDQGRLIRTIGPSHTVVIGGVGGTATTVQAVTWMVYNQSVEPGSGTWDVDSTWTGNGYYVPDTSTYTLVNPVSINKTDKIGRSTDQITSARSSGSGALSPTDTFDQTDWQTWSSTTYNDQGQTASSQNYFLIPSSGTGGVDYYSQTAYEYDALQRRNRVISAEGTITRTVWTATQWVASVWIGTDDAGATDSDPSNGGTAPNNMVMVTLNIYDNGDTSNPEGSGGDGNLLQQIQYDSATASRVTNFGYDFRDRRINMTDAIGRYATYSLDNLSRNYETDFYSSNLSGGVLIGKFTTAYDDLNRTFNTSTYAVNISTGAVGNYFISKKWYDPSGNLWQQVAEGDHSNFTKYQYNGVNWVTAAYRGYNVTGCSYDQASGVYTGDMIMSQMVPTYNEVGNVVSRASYARLTDDTTTGLPLSINSSPLARVSFSAAWFDGIDRPFASANYGASGTAPTIPSTPPSASSSGVLLDQTVYDGKSGRVDQRIDPKGLVTKMYYDNANRTTSTVEDYSTSSGHLNRPTNRTYNADNLVTQLQAVNANTGSGVQNTNYSYGTISTSGVYRNDLLSSVTYPDAGVVGYTYNRLGQVGTITDQRGTVRTMSYDLLGRATNDCVTTPGTGTDTAVLQIAAAYEIRGMLQLVTSYDTNIPNSGTVLNQVQLTYNTFGQLIEEDQEHGGAVTDSTPSVLYGYLASGGTSNQAWLSNITYPNGRILVFNHVASGGNLSRIDNILDGGINTLASYTYLGDDTVIRMTYPEPNVWLDLWGGGTTWEMSGMDQYGRVTNQLWQNNVTGTPVAIDQYQYGYDYNSNRTYKANVVGTAAVGNLDEGYSYDNLNRLIDMQRGTLSGGVITGTPTVEMQYTLDPTGNWSTYQNSSSGTVILNQGRVSNTVNEITSITASTGPVWVTPLYDPAGNMTTMPQPASPTSSFTAAYDAWNRMVSVNSSSGLLANYQYDGRGRRIVKYTASIPETRHFYYTSSWQDIEERTGTSTTMDKQYVWGVRYIDELVCRDDADNATTPRLYATQDANFNLTSVANASGGAIAERYVFDPYGNRAIMNGSWGYIVVSATDWVIGQQGLMQDQESKLLYNRMRYLSSQLGRFLSRDPIGYADSLNLSGALGENPLGFLDPSGLAKKCPCPGLFAAYQQILASDQAILAALQALQAAEQATLGLVQSAISSVLALVTSDTAANVVQLAGGWWLTTNILVPGTKAGVQALKVARKKAMDPATLKPQWLAPKIGNVGKITRAGSYIVIVAQLAAYAIDVNSTTNNIEISSQELMDLMRIASYLSNDLNWIQQHINNVSNEIANLQLIINNFSNINITPENCDKFTKIAMAFLAGHQLWFAHMAPQWTAKIQQLNQYQTSLKAAISGPSGLPKSDF